MWHVELCDELLHAISTFQRCRPRISHIELHTQAFRDWAKRCGAISAIKRMTCGIVIHDVTPCGTSHFGPIWCPNAWERTERCIIPPKIENHAAIRQFPRWANESLPLVLIQAGRCSTSNAIALAQRVGQHLMTNRVDRFHRMVERAHARRYR